jgi:hypothetical protein
MRLACRVLVLGLLLAVADGSVAAASLMPVAALQPAAGMQEVLGPVAVSGSTLVVATSPNYDTPIGASTPDSVFVFSETAGGWVDGYASARLVDSSGALPQPTALGVSGGTVVVSENSGAEPNFEDVFLEPAGGWSGTVTESARLVAPGAVLYGVQVSGDTAVVSASTLPLGVPETLVGAPVNAPVVDGRAIVASAGTHGDVFLEPGGGWAGTVTEAATLDTRGSGDGGLAIAGRVAIDGPYVYSEPVGGWRGTVSPAGSLYTTGDVGGFPGTPVLSGSIAAFSSDRLGSEHSCPCTGAVFLFTRPPSGWSEEIGTNPALTPGTLEGPVPMAIEAQQLFVSGGTTINVYRVSGRFGRTAPPPTVAQTALTGLATGRPRLRLTATAGLKAPLLTAITVRLSKGLSFARNRARLLANTIVSGVRSPSLALTGGALHVNVPARRTITITVRGPAITESARLRQVAQPGPPPIQRQRLQILITTVFGNVTNRTVLLEPT